MRQVLINQYLAKLDRSRRGGPCGRPVAQACAERDKSPGTIPLDSETTLVGVPPNAWRYQLGNRCAIEWVLNQYKEKKPKDPTIREKFDTYRFADHKVIELLARVITVSVETMRIIDDMKAASR